ncbi:MAG TPA: bifunctional 4-hydroxy-2-oxoglutarate aldolase/2-dehydro-3-deoxy-phosphogluconate aldolase [Flavihumibacter sp.]|jgi:2-dehydro-3-deoxyphosphogluconate aldolase/(4S)-4-hydroxy-2-oxoglutarate aldolase
MSDHQTIYQALRKQKLLPLFYHPEQEVCVNTIQALYDGGIRIIEFTNRGENALQQFAELIQMRATRWPELLLAIGTVKTPEQARDFLAAGADFIICPGTVKEVGEITHAAGKVWIPGAMTVSEILLAQSVGAGFIKLFPGNLLGPSFMAGIRDIFPDLYFMPTGGVELTIDNLQAWFDAGVSAVGLGSKFLSKDLLARKNFAEITRLSKQALELAQQVK